MSVGPTDWQGAGELQQTPSRIEIPTFPQNKRIAFTSSWDDGPVDDRELVELLNRYNLPATFHLITGTLDQNDSRGQFVSSSEVARLYAGHEVAMHTQTHPILPDLDALQIAQEIIENRKGLEDLVGYPVRGMSYPYGSYANKVQSILRSLGISYARTVENGGNAFPPNEPMAWAPTCHVHVDGALAPVGRWESFYNNRFARGLFNVWGHSYDIARKSAWPAFERFCATVANKPDVWYCTAIQLFDYEAARSRVSIAANRKSAFNPSAQPVTLRVDGKVIDIPPGQTISLIQQSIPQAA